MIHIEFVCMLFISYIIFYTPRWNGTSVLTINPKTTYRFCMAAMLFSIPFSAKVIHSFINWSKVITGIYRHDGAINTVFHIKYGRQWENKQSRWNWHLRFPWGVVGLNIKLRKILNGGNLTLELLKMHIKQGFYHITFADNAHKLLWCTSRCQSSNSTRHNLNTLLNCHVCNINTCTRSYIICGYVYGLSCYQIPHPINIIIWNNQHGFYVHPTYKLHTESIQIKSCTVFREPSPFGLSGQYIKWR
jgi:hypothetical protein